jgi:endonuclease/exonuclease/phosphatase family metal-dependent hydrolase
MRKTYLYTFGIAIIFLFFFQMTGTLVESIYILDLLNTALDEKALGLLFFFSPVLLIPFRKRVPDWIVKILIGLLIVARGITPYLDTTGKMLASGIGTGVILLLFPILLSATLQEVSRSLPTVWAASGLAFGVGLSVMLRTINYSIDYSLTPVGSWVGWGVGLILGFVFLQLKSEPKTHYEGKSKGRTSAVLGIILVLTLIIFVFSAPGVLARWTQGNYQFIVILVSLMSLIWTAVCLRRPSWIGRISSKGLLLWNLVFSISLVGTILAHRVPFPLTQNSPPVVVGTPTFFQQIPLGLAILLLPIILLDFQIFIKSIRNTVIQPVALVPGLLIGSLAFVLLVFMFIFTNVWGYIEPVSPFFRNKFWLPFALITGTLSFLVFLHRKEVEIPQGEEQDSLPWGWVLLVGGIFLLTLVTALGTDRVKTMSSDQSSLLLMTYNIQQANDAFGNKSYEQQLALIQRISPDILALQESDSARISLNNNDYVRYFASKLGYYSYYGPKTVSGTYGTAILSKYPLQNPHTVFSYSDQDEIGTAVAEVAVDGRVFTILNVHPDGSDTAMQVFAQTLLTLTRENTNVIALGDFNLREGEAAYEMIDAAFSNAWINVYPDGIGTDGLDMSGRQRIDHIFLSPHLHIRDAFYLLAPESATDHPVHWAEVFWLE